MLLFSRFLHVGGGRGFRGLHDQPDGGAAVVDVGAAGSGGGAAGFVSGGGGVVVFGVGVRFSGGGSWLSVVVLLGGWLSGGGGGVLYVEVDQVVAAGGLPSGSSLFALWIAMPSSTPSNADPNTAEPPAAHSARTAVLLWSSRVKSGRARSRGDRGGVRERLPFALSAAPGRGLSGRRRVLWCRGGPGRGCHQRGSGVAR